MKKVAIITDTHCGAGNDNRFLNESFLRFYEDLFFPYLIKHNIKNVIHLGDTFDRRKYVNFNTLNSWREKVFSRLNSMCDRVDILIGNHDTYFKQTNEVNSVRELLFTYDKFNIITNAQEVEFYDRKILYLPWICDDNKEASLELLNTSDSKLCMGHLEISGFELYAGHVTDKGMSRSTFDRFFLTLSGHFHQKGTIGNIHYLGAPYPMMWGDYACDRGFHVLDFETLDLEFIKNEESTFHKIYYDDSKDGDKDLTQDDYSYLKNKFIKVVVKTKNSPYLFDRYVEYIQSYNPADLTIIDHNFDDAQKSDDDVDQTKDTLTILNECIDSLEGDKYKDALKDLLRE